MSIRGLARKRLLFLTRIEYRRLDVYFLCFKRFLHVMQAFRGGVFR